MITFYHLRNQVSGDLLRLDINSQNRWLGGTFGLIQISHFFLKKEKMGKKVNLLKLIV